MLVLSRRANQEIVLPEVGISLKILEMRRSVVKVGIQAPRNVRVLRGEIHSQELQNHSSRDCVHVLSRDEFHHLKNQLNTIQLSLKLLQRQREAGFPEEAEATLSQLLQQVDAFDKGLMDRNLEPVPSPDRLALLVEDDDNERALLASLLRMSGYEVVTSQDGLEALDYLKSHQFPDVVLLDMRMPRCDGPTTIQAIRSAPALAKLPIFAVSATDPSEFGVPVGSRGINGWFPKPLNTDSLTREISKLGRLAASA